MIQIIPPGRRTGDIEAPSSKSMAHRFLISGALGDQKLLLDCPGISRDIEATMACLNALGAKISNSGSRIAIVSIPVSKKDTGKSEVSVLPCGESGSTLRFLLPVVGAFGLPAAFRMEGRLPQRPMTEFEEELTRHGMSFRREENLLFCSGQLQAGDYSLPGNISSQYFSGLLFALPLLSGESRMEISGTLESEDYLHLTESVLLQSGIQWKKSGPVYQIPGNQKYRLPFSLRVEGDYSNGAFFLCAGAISGGSSGTEPSGITVGNLDPDSKQGDKRITDVLLQFGADISEEEQKIHVRQGSLRGIVIDASMIPDLIPVLSVVAAVSEGETRIVHGERLRMKESDRIKSTVQMLQALGAHVEETEDGMIIRGKPALEGGTVDPCRDHRIAMAAAVAACACKNPVTVLDAECVEKSYPLFWQDFAKLTIR